MSYLYVLCAFAVLMAMAFVKEGAPPAWHNYAILLLFIPIALIAFLLPTAILRRSLLKAKDDLVSALALELNVLSAEIRKDALATRTAHEPPRSLYSTFSSLKTIYDHALQIKEWPFTVSVFVKIGLAIATPVVIVVAQRLALKCMGL